LAFSIATSVDPDILIIDEALSVGDAHFQRKCIERMMGFKQQGKTILFCSHAMYLVQEMCDHAIWLRQGRIERYGEAREVIAAYTSHLEIREAHPAAAPTAPDHISAPEIMIEEVALTGPAGEPLEALQQFQPMAVTIRTRRHGKPLPGHLGAGIIRPDGQLIFGASTKAAGLPPIQFQGRQTFRLAIPRLPLNSALCRARAVVGDEYLLRSYHQADSDQALTVLSPTPEFGMTWIEHRWEIGGEAGEI
jgi:hypothetical protein